MFVLLLLLATVEGCMFPASETALPLRQAVINAPTVVYGKVIKTHTIGQAVEPIQFQVYCSYNLEASVERTSIIEFAGDFLGNSCSATDVQEEQEYIVLLKAVTNTDDDDDSAGPALHIYKANGMTSAAFEPTMEHLKGMANGKCEQGHLVAGTPPYIMCPRPSSDCVPPPQPLFTTQSPVEGEDGEEEEEEEEEQGILEAEAAPVMGQASQHIQSPSTLLLLLATVFLSNFLLQRYYHW